MSFPILVSHIGSTETITIPTVFQIPIFSLYIFHMIFGGYKLFKISRSKTIKIEQGYSTSQDYKKTAFVQGGVLGII